MAKQLMKRVIKKSNVLVLAAAALVIVALFFFDISLKDAYLSGEYKKPFRDYKALNFKGFKSIVLNAATAANVIVQQGDFSVKMEPAAEHFIKVSQIGDVLYINAAFPGSFEGNHADYPLVITCPVLEKFDADSRYTANNMLVTDTIASLDFRWRPSFIKGFTLDSLAITEKHAGTVILQANKIKSLKATIGLNEGSGSNLTILNDNRFENADLNILNKSQLKLQDAGIPNLKYQLADSAKLILTGAAKKLINKQ